MHCVHKHRYRRPQRGKSIHRHHVSDSDVQGFGCMSLTPGFYGTSKDIDMAESEKVLRAAIDSGMTLANTADFYSTFEEGGEVSENIKLIGRLEAAPYLT